MNMSAVKMDEEIGQNETVTDKLSHSSSKGRLLVIDDDMGMQSLLSDVLCGAGYSVTVFSDAVGALKLITAGDLHIDAVICDLNMPKLSGMDFLDMVAKMNLKIPVILITAFGTRKTETEARTKGAFGYLSKPFQLSEINTLIQKAVA